MAFTVHFLLTELRRCCFVRVLTLPALLPMAWSGGLLQFKSPHWDGSLSGTLGKPWPSVNLPCPLQSRFSWKMLESDQHLNSQVIIWDPGACACLFRPPLLAFVSHACTRPNDSQLMDSVLNLNGAVPLLTACSPLRCPLPLLHLLCLT